MRSGAGRALAVAALLVASWATSLPAAGATIDHRATATTATATSPPAITDPPPATTLAPPQIFASTATALDGDASQTTITTGDVDGDGRLDIVNADDWSAAPWLRVRLQQADATFATAEVTPLWCHEATRIVVGDLTGDGRAEIVVGCDAYLAVFARGAPGSYTRTLVATPQGAPGLTLADVDHDGDADLLMTKTGKLWLYRGSPSGLGAATQVTSYLGGALTTTDLDGDGRADLVGEAGDRTYALVSDPVAPTGFTAVTSPLMSDGAPADLSPMTPETPAFADFDGDGSPEAVAFWIQSRTGKYFVSAVPWSGTGWGTPSYRPASGLARGRLLSTADMNFDGRPDITVASTSGHWVSVALSAGDGFAPWSQQPLTSLSGQIGLPLAGAATEAVGDLDGDGLPDLVTFDVKKLWIYHHRPSNHPPAASDGSLATARGRSAAGRAEATDPDGDPLTLVVDATSPHGTVSGPASGFTYTPDPSFVGVDQIGFTAYDDWGVADRGTIAVRVTPVADGPAGTVRSITAGTIHTCALLGGGVVKCWGGNDYGQLGQGDGLARGNGPGEMGTDLLPVDLGAGHRATTVDAGTYLTCALREDGRVVCWGANWHGGLGVGDTEERGDDPDEMGDHLTPVDLGSGRTALDVSAGNGHTCALLDDHSVKCWGANDEGQLGLGDTDDRGDAPGELGDALPAVDLGTGRSALAVATGADHTCAILDDHTVKCWGDSYGGALGLGDREARGDAPGAMGDALPTVDLGTGRTATAITAGWSFTCALLDDHTVKCWGSNSFGQLGIGDTHSRGNGTGEMGDALPPVDLGTGRSALAVAAGGNHTCALLADHTVRCWGYNTDGQLGIGDQVSRGKVPGDLGDAMAPIDLGTGRSATAIVAGSAHTCALLDDGSAKCWGSNSAGRLGIGSTTYHGARPGDMGDALPPVDLLGTGIGIAGHVTDASGSALTGVAVLALDTADYSAVTGAVTNGAGAYAMDVAPGTYLLYLVKGTRASFDASRAPVTVSTGLTSAELVLPADRGAIAGTVADATTSSPITGAWAIALGPTGAPETATLQSSTSFTLGNVRPGPHHLVFVDPTGAHAPRFAPSSPDLAGSAPVTVTAGTTVTAGGSLPPQTRVPATAGVSGRVTDATGTAVRGALVVALRAGDFGFEAGAVSTTTGDYTLALAPGDYALGFISPSGRFATGWYQAHATGDLGAATPVHAPATAVDVTVVPTTATIRGTVTRGSITRSGMVVLAIGPNGVAGAATSLTGGGYGIFDLAPGTYRAAIVDPNDGRVEFWPDQPTYAAATPFPIAAGATATANADLDAPP